MSELVLQHDVESVLANIIWAARVTFNIDKYSLSPGGPDEWRLIFDSDNVAALLKVKEMAEGAAVRVISYPVEEKTQ